MIRTIYKKEEFFLDVPDQISTTGSYPTRGFYFRIMLDNGVVFWTDKNGREINSERWDNYLEKQYGEMNKRASNDNS